MIRAIEAARGLAACLVPLVLAACSEPVVTAGGDGVSAAPPDSHPCSLAPGAELLELSPEPTEYPLAPGESHAYALEFVAGEYIEVVAEQDGVDLSLVLLDGRNDPLITADRMTGDRGPEHLGWWSDNTSRHVLLACGAEEKDAVVGSYRLWITARRPASGEDRRSVAAAKAFFSAQTDRPGTPDSVVNTVATYRQALALWEQLGDERAGEALFLLAQIHDNELDEPRLAIEHYRRALPYFEDPIAVEVRAATLHGLGHAHFQLGEIDRARAAYEKALELRHDGAFLDGEAVTSNNLGLVYELLGETPRALDAFDRAIALWRRLANRFEEATSLHNRGKAYLALGDDDRALDDLERALAIRRSLAEPRREAATLAAIGLVHLMRRELDQAFDFHQRSLELREASGDRHGIALSLNNLGLTASSLGRHDRALEYYEQALPIFETLDDRRNQALLRHNVGGLLVARDPEEALRHFAQALPVFEEVGDRPRRAWTLSKMAEAERRRDRLDAARELLDEALTEVESLRTQPASQALRASYFANQQWTYDLYVDLLMELHRRQPTAGHDLAALSVSERAKARSQLDALIDAGAGVRSTLDESTRERLERLQTSIQTMEEQRLRLLQEPSTEAQLMAVESRLRELVFRHERLWGEIRGSGGAVGQSLLTAPEIRRIADPETLILEYDLGRERSYLWAITDEEIQSFELPGSLRIEELTRRAYRLLTASHGRRWRAQTGLVLAELGELLLGPVTGRLDNRRLVLIGEGVLDYLPWGALPIPGDGTSLVADRHEVVSIPSASTLATLRRNVEGRQPPPGALAIFADPVFSPADPRVDPSLPRGSSPDSTRAEQFERLSHSRKEAEAILELLPPEASRLAAFDFTASRDLAASGELADYRLLHFATHGEIDATHPQLSRLIFSRVDEEGRKKPGFLFAHEIYGLEMPADLVVLSACRTALGREIRGEGLVGLTQSFFFAGAARVLVSLWNVDDKVTAELMTAFYRHLLEGGMRPASALRAAQADIRGDPRWNARYYWAGFVLKGEWR